MKKQVKGNNSSFGGHSEKDATFREFMPESDTLLLTVIQNTFDPVYIKDRDSRIIICNTALGKIVGKPVSEIIGKTDGEYYEDPVVGKKLRESDLLVMESGKSQIVEETVNTPLGVRTFISSKSPYYSESGELVGIVGISHDITDRKRAEDSLKKSEQKYRTIIETAQEGVWILDEALSTVYVNPRMAEMIGYQPAEMFDKSLTSFAWDNGKLISDRKLKERKKRTMPLGSYEYILKCKDGSPKWVIINSTPQYDENNRYTGSLNMISDISELKETERLLKESEEKYMELVTNARSIILKMDTMGRFTYINQFALDFFGYNNEELIGKTAFETIVPRVESSGRDLVGLVESIYEDPDKFSVNINEAIKRNGERVWVEWYNKALFDREGKRSGHIAIGIDITQRILAEESLKQSEEKLRSVLDAAQESIYMFDKEGRFTMSNSIGFKRFHDIPEKDFIGHKFSEFMSNDLAIQRQQKLDEVFRTGNPLEFEDERKGMIFHHNFVPVFSKGDIVNVATFSTDITKRRMIERELLESRERLRIALENGNIGIWEWNLLTDEVIWDERTEEMFGLLPGTFGKTFGAFFELVHEEDTPHIRKAMNAALEQGLPYETIFRVRTAGGKLKFISSKALINKDPDGKPVSMTGVTFDVTELREGTEQLILKLNEDLLRSNKELESFAYVASHDLQEPLRSITSFTQLLSHKYRDKLDDRANEYIDFIVEGAVRMYDLLNGLLDYSRINTRGKIFQSVDLSRILVTAKKNLALKIRETGAQIKVDELPVISGDENQMVQLFQNLIINSIKFNTKVPRIHISSKSEPDAYIISFTDNGIGIEAQYFEKIFAIFQRLHSRDQYEGTGIGLAICRRIVERHAGNIWVESDPGRGSTFFVRLPKN
ncbi:MAG: PAS domain S-box protein [Bacteroidales bacterium]